MGASNYIIICKEQQLLFGIHTHFQVFSRILEPFSLDELILIFSCLFISLTLSCHVFLLVKCNEVWLKLMEENPFQRCSSIEILCVCRYRYLYYIYSHVKLRFLCNIGLLRADLLSIMSLRWLRQQPICCGT